MSTAIAARPSSRPRPHREAEEKPLPISPDNPNDVLRQYDSVQSLSAALARDTKQKFKAIFVKDNQQVDAIAHFKEKHPDTLRSYVLRAANDRVMQRLNDLFQGKDPTKSKAIQEIGRFPGMNDENKNDFAQKFQDQMAFLQKSAKQAYREGKKISIIFYSSAMTNHYGIHTLRAIRELYPNVIEGKIVTARHEIILGTPEADAYEGYPLPADKPVESAAAATKKQPWWQRAAGAVGNLFGRK